MAWYNQSLGLFERFLARSGLSTFLKDVGEEEVRTFIADLQSRRKWADSPHVHSDQPLSGEGIQNRVRALKAFFAWLHREGYTEVNRLAGLRNFKAPQKVVDVLSEEEIGQVLAAIDDKTSAGCRDFSIVVLMLDSGLRLSEVIGLLDEDLDIDAGNLKVMGKGSKERMVPFGAVTQKALWRYRHHYRPEPANPGVGNFFLTQEGQAMTEAERRACSSAYPHGQAWPGCTPTSAGTPSPLAT